MTTETVCTQVHVYMTAGATPLILKHCTVVLTRIFQ